MNQTAAAWVRTYAWTDDVRELNAQVPVIGGGAECLCQEPFTCAPCSASLIVDHRRDRIRIHAPDTMVVTAGGVIYETTQGGREAPLAVWLADRMCTQWCSGPPEEPMPEMLLAGQEGLW